MSSLDLLRPFLTEVAAPRPPVTGGATSAATVATAASLVAMTVRIGASAPDRERRAAHAEELAGRALELAASDSDSYAVVLAARRRPHDDPERGTAVRQALAAAARPPADIAELAAEVAESAAGLVAEVGAALGGDAITAATLAAGAAEGCAALARINVTAAGGGVDVAETAERAENAAASARKHADAAARSAASTRD